MRCLDLGSVLLTLVAFDTLLTVHDSYDDVRNPPPKPEVNESSFKNFEMLEIWGAW